MGIIAYAFGGIGLFLLLDGALNLSVALCAVKVVRHQQPDVIETDTSYYVVKLDKVNDEEATETKKQSIISTRENKLYTDTTEKWLDDADINVEKKVLKTLKVTDNHKFSIATATT